MRWIVLAFTLVGCRACRDDSTSVVVDASEPIAVPFEAAPGPKRLDACRRILLLDEKGDVLAFNPVSPSIDKVSHASCDFGTDLGPRSMAVENNGTMWMGTFDGRIVLVHPDDGRCERTPFAAEQSGFSQLNLTFVGDTLWAADDHGWGGDVPPSKGLATIDRAKLVLSPVGQPHGASSFVLAGTRDGKLYAQPPVTIGTVDLDKKKPVFKALTGFEDFAKAQGAPMAFYDGVLYLFQGSAGLFYKGETAGVLRFDPATKKFESVYPVIEGTIVSAGSAPCAGSK